MGRKSGNRFSGKCMRNQRNPDAFDSTAANHGLAETLACGGGASDLRQNRRPAVSPACSKPAAMAWEARWAGCSGPATRAFRCCSSVVEHSIGNGEVDSSILSSSTSLRCKPLQAAPKLSFPSPRRSAAQPGMTNSACLPRRGPTGPREGEPSRGSAFQEAGFPSPRRSAAQPGMTNSACLPR